MKSKKLFISLFLLAALLISMTGCNTGAGTPTEPAGPVAADVFNQAKATLDTAASITLDLTATKTTTVAEDVFSEKATQVLTYSGIGTENAIIALEEKTQFGVHGSHSSTDGAPSAVMEYAETWTGGQLYTQLSNLHFYSSTVDAEAATARYTPVILFDTALYGSITSEATETGTKISFAEATGFEAWAAPQDAELVEASGTAQLDAAGALTEMQYTLTYAYGPAQIKLEVQSKPQATAKEVSAPADTSKYTAISYPDALRVSMRTPALLEQADDITISGMESMFSQAVGLLMNQSHNLNAHGHKAGTNLKVDTNIYYMDYSTGESEEAKQEETYIDGKLTTVANGGLPSVESGLTWQNIREYISTELEKGLPDLDNLKDVTFTDLGSVYFLEYQFNDNFGNTTQNNFCQMLFNDPAFLTKLSSKYENKTLTGYLSLDKYTGLPIAAGTQYEGIHTIEGQDYALTVQYDQSIEAPALGAYQEITDKLPEEAEPEEKPTPLFYHVTGANGQEMWLLGTIHVGDAKTAYLPKQIKDAFAASDALAMECDTKAFDEQVENDEKLAEQVSALYFYEDGTTLESMLEKEDYEQALKLLKATGGYNMNMPYAKPSIWSEAIEQFYLRQGYALHRDYGVEERLYDWAEELDKKIIEVESSLFQIKMTTGFSKDLQLMLLEDAVTGSASEYWTGVQDLYNKWCAGDEAVLREEISTAVDTSEMTEEEKAEYEAVKHLIDEYNKAMGPDRNEGMLKKAIEYLESGDVVFYAVGLAHLLDNTNGLVDTLQEAGYTVEQVTFAN